MGAGVRLAMIVLLGLAVAGCGKSLRLLDHVDLAYFRRFATTLVAGPEVIGLKELHLDRLFMVGKDVIVSGNLVEVGRFGTYAVLSDGNARLLVVLTDVDWRAADSGTRSALSIYGTIEHGKKGLPYLLAKAISVPSGTMGEGAVAGIRTDLGRVL